MTVSVKHLPRAFEIKGTLIPDPTPQLPIDRSLELLSKTYPMLRHTRVYESDGTVIGDKLVYKIVPPPVKTNG